MEAKKVIENVQAITLGQTVTGTLRLTDFHMVFSAPVDESDPASADPPQAPKKREKWITYPILSQCAFRPMPSSTHILSSIRIRCRDFTFVTFSFTESEIAREAFEFIKSRTCKLGTVENLFAFSHKPLRMEKEMNGWEVYDPRAEFRRQGISEKLPDKGWRISTINKDYTFCDTYPAVLAVPSKISDNVLKYAKDFRSRNRIPVLSYIHPINNCTITRSSQPFAGITRKTNVQDEKLVAASFAVSMNASGSEETTPMSSQPDIASIGAAMEPELSETERYEDELISKSAGGAMYDEKTGRRLIYGAQQSNLIVDARPTINAMVNQVQGMGSENMDRYKFSRKIFLSIDNIHVMRTSLNKVVDVLKDSDLSSLAPSQDLLQQSKWLKHIHDVLDGSAIIARQVGIIHSNVLIHCSDGWDRTSQLSALAELMLDPYYRTLEGFIVLVEKDWLSFGHMFRLRSGHLSLDAWFTVQKDGLVGAPVQPGDNDGRNDALQSMINTTKRIFIQNKDDADPATMGEAASGKVVEEEATTAKMVSPIFHQFLDCTYQLLRQNPGRFEFNERFLRRLFYHVYSCQYGTFLYNSEKQRVEAKVAERTSSVWDYFLCRRAEFTNPGFDPTVDDHVKGRERILLPRLNEVRWWYQLFGRTDDEMNGGLNAAAVAESERQAALLSLQLSNVGQSDEATGSPMPCDETLSPAGKQSVLASVETAHETLTPRARQGGLKGEASSEGMNPFSVVREGISGLAFGKSMLSNFGFVDEPVPGPSAKPPPARSEQELREMT